MRSAYAQQAKQVPADLPLSLHKCIYHLSGEHITTLSHLSFTSLSLALFLSPSLLMHILHAKEQQCLSTIRSGICGSSLRAFDWLIHVKLNIEEGDFSSCCAYCHLLNGCACVLKRMPDCREYQRRGWDLRISRQRWQLVSERHWDAWHFTVGKI